MSDMDLYRDAYDANERMYFYCNQEPNCFVVKHIDVNWATTDDLSEYRNMHFLVVCINEVNSLQKFEKMLCYDHLDETNVNRFPVECSVVNRQDYLDRIVGPQQAQRIEDTEVLLGHKWSKYYVGCSEEEGLIGLAVNQLREMCYSQSKEICSRDADAVSREGFFCKQGLHFIRDRKTFGACKPKSSLDNYVGWKKGTKRSRDEI